VRRAGMVGATTYTAARGAPHEAGRAGRGPGWIEELEALRNALTDDEFEFAKRHLLAGERGERG
jgi:hypothetical protein